MDLYLRLAYPVEDAPEGFEPERFEFMNGRAASKELLTDTRQGGERELWYRIQANLYTEPRFGNYPYDRQSLRLVLEHAIHPAHELVYRPAMLGDGLDEDVRVSGWRIGRAFAEVEEKAYPFNETYSRFTYTVHVDREPLAATLRSFLPPLAFGLVSGLSFLLHPSKIAQRITFGTTMLISAVGFHVSQTVALPTLGRLTLFDEVMLSLYAFLAASLVVTTTIAYAEDHRKDPAAWGRINRRGAVLALAVPVAVFLLLRAI